MRTLLAALCMVFILAAAPAYPHTGDQLKKKVDIEIVSDRGTKYLTIPHREFWSEKTRIIKKYQVAVNNEKYGIIIRNNSPERVGVVVAVDGRNIISGKRSNLRSSEEMYVIGGYEQTRFDGWRTARDTVHRFYFTDSTDAYAVRTFKDSSALGVIAVAVFREQRTPDRFFELNLQNGAPAPVNEGRASGKTRSAEQDDALGTGFGDGQYSPSSRVVFEPVSYPFQKTLIKYERRETLCREGILDCSQPSGNRLWDLEAFAPYPPAY
jgi:hypothetical protein